MANTTTFITKLGSIYGRLGSGATTGMLSVLMRTRQEHQQVSHFYRRTYVILFVALLWGQKRKKIRENRNNVLISQVPNLFKIGILCRYTTFFGSTLVDISCSWIKKSILLNRCSPAHFYNSLSCARGRHSVRRQNSSNLIHHLQDKKLIPSDFIPAFFHTLCQDLVVGVAIDWCIIYTTETHCASPLDFDKT